MRVLGIDGGIASVGWAVIDENDQRSRIVAAGVRTFDAPETDKERTPTNAVRRQKRGLRRVIRRRRQRMATIRRLFVEYGLLTDNGRDALRLPSLDPWQLRAEALDRLLSREELAAALGHIARHRGFRSNSKRDNRSNAADDSSKMLSAIDATRECMQRWRTVGEMFARDPGFRERKRNRSSDYSRSVLRADQEQEVSAIFAAQRRLGSGTASPELEEAFADIAFSQRPLQDSEHLLETCPFERGETRTARRAYSFELFRLLARLNNLRLVAGRHEPQRLDTNQIGIVAKDFGAQKRMTFKSVRKALELHPATRFEGIALEDEGRDIVARAGNAAEGSYALRKVTGESVWRLLTGAPATLDRIGEVLTFREASDRIHAGLVELGLEAAIVDVLMRGVADGAFREFRGAGHISAKAARTLLEPLRRGLGYAEACAEVEYDHAAQREIKLTDVGNPVARKALGEMLKQVRAIVHEYGLPDRIHVELARDVGKSAEERDEITRGIEKRNREKDKRREEFREMLGQDPTAEDLLRYELWKEQNGRCLYSDEPIQPNQIFASDNAVQVDHILPWSRFGDDSFFDKTLCTARANQSKGGRTPFEWFAQEKTADEWTAFERRVEGCKEMRGRKKRGFYLRHNAQEVQDAFRNRNLGDTRYATRVLLGLLRRLYPDQDARHVFARPGNLTARLRREWGLESLKKDETGKRVEDDRHHALDAIVITATTESMLNRLTKAFQESERRGDARSFPHVDEPWPGFRDEVISVMGKVFVSRAERRRARGEAHAATIRQVKKRDGKIVVYERRAIDALKPVDLERVKDTERNGAIIEALRAWLDVGKPKDALPRSPKGDVIRKVRLSTDAKVAVEVRGGTADRGEIVRVDVFREASTGKRRDRFHLVPIYPHQVADRQSWPKPPDRAVVADKSESEWTPVGGFTFLFSLYANSLVQVEKSDGEVITGYFRGAHRGTGAVTISPQETQQRTRSGIGAKTLLSLRKYAVDRLGRISEVERESRTWHGVVCT